MSTPKKVFVSYKYSDIVEGREETFNFRDELIKRLGSRGFRHKGEDDESYDLSDYTEDQIRAKIFPDIKNSSITVVLISPNTYQSKWIPWEISLSLRARIYEDQQSKTRNGIIGVYVPLNNNLEPAREGTYTHYFTHNNCGTTGYRTDSLPKIMIDNTFNLKNGSYECSLGCCPNVYSMVDGSYIGLVTWDDFISNMDHYINLAWKRRNNFDNYDTRINLENGV